jgi:hypothetical protein
MDTLISSTVILKWENGYYEIDSDIDVVRNTRLFILPS